MPSEVFEAQAALLVRALPYVAAETCSTGLGTEDVYKRQVLADGTSIFGTI